MDKQLIGRALLIQGFSAWVRYMFKAIENKPFVVEPIHEGLLEGFENLYKGITTRLNINVPPRSGKTTLAKYFLVYILTLNPKCNVIYTSYSQSLLTDIATSVRAILEHPVYKALYPSNVTFETEEVNAIDDFWLDYLKRETGKNIYSSKKITTAQGGVCLFSSIGSQITGYGAGIRNGKGFTGALIIDDANKPADIRSQVMREKVIMYYEETLLSRLNDSTVPIINIQQRLHLEDLSGILEKKYNFETLRRPLLDENGVCQLPTQYTQERIDELKVNNYMFVAQYQQQPIILGGAVIKRDWFNYYSLAHDYKYNKIVIAGDTALKAKEHSDYTCFLVGGVTEQGKLHILQMVHAKLEYPDLKRTIVNLYNSWKFTDKTSCSGVYLEDKASGINLIQDLKVLSVPVIPIEVTKDKLTRVEEILDYLASGQVMLPSDEQYGDNPTFLAECDEFTRDLTQVHDDIVDTLVHLINNTIANRKISILDVL